jgi:hypothetical protein
VHCLAEKRHKFFHGWTGVQAVMSECVMHWCEFIASKRMGPIIVDELKLRKRAKNIEQQHLICNNFLEQP